MPQGASNKKKYTYVWVSAVILVFGIFTMVEVTKRLEDKAIVDTDRSIGVPSQKNLAYIMGNGKKRKVPDFAFINQDSVLVTNKDYLGKVYLVDFFFTTCPSICPIMTTNLVEIQEAFKDIDAFGVASFTINPSYDTPEVLRKYKNKYGANNSNWNLLTGDQEKIYQLAREGFYIFANEVEGAPGGFEHSGMFALVDKQGFIRSRVVRSGENENPLIYYRGTITQEQGVNEEGEPQQITILKEDIKRLLAE